MLDNLAHVRFALGLVGGRLDVLEGVGREDEDGVVDDDLRVCPAGGEACVRVRSKLRAGDLLYVLTSGISRRTAPAPPC